MIESVDLSTVERSTDELQHVIENNARMGRIRAFAWFVQRELYPLAYP